MAQTKEAQQQSGAVYSLQGTLIEACSCNVLCPCWIGEDPDSGECFAIVAWHIDTGQVYGIDVSGHSVVAIAHIPGNVLAGNWELVLLVDDHTSPEQRDAYTQQRAGTEADTRGKRTFRSDGVQRESDQQRIEHLRATVLTRHETRRHGHGEAEQQTGQQRPRSSRDAR